MKKITSIFIVILIMSPLLFGAGEVEQQKEKVTVNVAVPTGFPAISIAPMAVDNPEILDGYSTEYEVIKSPDLMAGKLLSGEADIAIVPTNLSVRLFNKGTDLVLAGTAVWGILYIVTSEDISGWDDLKGREVNMLGRGLTPDIVFRYLLDANGLEADKDVRIKYVHSSSELAPAFITDKSTISVMPEPLLSMVMTKKKNTTILLDLQKEWQKVLGGDIGFPQASLVINRKLINEHPEYVNKFIALYAAGIERINSDPLEAGTLSAQILDSPPAKIISKAIPGGNLRWEAAQMARPALEHYLNVLLGHSKDSLGGGLPDDSFYYEP